MQDREEIRKELLELGEGYDYVLDDMMRVLEDGFITDELIWDRKLINFAMSKGAQNFGAIAFEDDLENGRI